LAQGYIQKWALFLVVLKSVGWMKLNTFVWEPKCLKPSIPKVFHWAWYWAISIHLPLSQPP
jgi:hypothetical protein